MLLEKTADWRRFAQIQVRSNLPGSPSLLGKDDLGGFTFELSGPLPVDWYLAIVPVLDAGEKRLDLASWGCVSSGISERSRTLRLVPDLPGGAAAAILEQAGAQGGAMFFNAVRARDVLASRGLDVVSLDFSRVFRDLESGSLSSWSLDSREDCTAQVLATDSFFVGAQDWKDAAGRLVSLDGGHLWAGLNTLCRLDAESGLLQVLLLDCSKAGDGKWKSLGRLMECRSLEGTVLP